MKSNFEKTIDALYYPFVIIVILMMGNLGLHNIKFGDNDMEKLYQVKYCSGDSSLIFKSTLKAETVCCYLLQREIFATLGVESLNIIAIKDLMNPEMFDKIEAMELVKKSGKFKIIKPGDNDEHTKYK